MLIPAQSVAWGQIRHSTEALVEGKMRGWGTEGGGKFPESTLLKFDVKQPLQKAAKFKAIPNQGKLQISFCCKLS